MINDNKPIWTRPASELEESDYNQFYLKHFNEPTSPLAYTHFKLEGTMPYLPKGDNRFTGLIYIPADAPKNFLQPDQPVTHAFQLFVRRVFITDELTNLIPKWLSFIKVIIDSDDMPLNVSRETLQNHASLKIIKNKIVSKALGLLSEISEKKPEVYERIHKTYNKALRYGFLESKQKHQDVIKSLMRFETSKAKSVSFDEYVKQMKEGQPQIYFATGTSASQIKTAPLVEKVLKRGYEVVMVTDPLEEYVFADKLKSYKEFNLQNVAKDGLLFGDEGTLKSDL